VARDPSQNSTVNRLASRADAGLRRKTMPGGGAVYTGDVASRSLEALGARAMTVDRSIIVSEDFDPNRPEDQALFAHEQYHLEHSGGAGTHESRDAEEAAARAVERAVLSRARAGGTESHEASHVHAPAGAPNGAAGAKVEKDKGSEKEGAAARGYQALKGQGYSHQAILDRLVHEVLLGMESSRDQRFDRGGDKKGWL
jgi:hypothetical protein